MCKLFYMFMWLYKCNYRLFIGHNCKKTPLSGHQRGLLLSFCVFTLHILDFSHFTF